MLGAATSSKQELLEARQATSNMLGAALAMAALASTEEKEEKQARGT